MKFLRVIISIVLSQLGLSESTSSVSNSLHNTFSTAKFFSSINFNASTCVNFILTTKYDTNLNSLRNLEIIDLHVFPVVLVEAVDFGEDEIAHPITETNRRLPCEGCRILVDLSNKQFGHVAPSDFKKQATQVFTYEFEFHYRAEPNLTSFIRGYRHRMDTSVRPYARILQVSAQMGSYFVFCISCEPQCKLITGHQNPYSPSEIKRYCLLRSHGQKLFAYVRADTAVRKRIREPQVGREACEYITALNIYGKRCTYEEVIVRLIAERLNVSFEVDYSIKKDLPLIDDFSDEEELPGETDSNPGLIMCVAICYPDIENYLNGRVVASLLDDDKSYALYCNDHVSSEDPTWLEIFDLCDVYTWIGIIASALAAGMINWNIRYSLDVIFILLGQQQQCSWRREKKDILLGTFILSLMILNQDYLSYLTNQVTAPLQNYKIHNLVELFDSGYRIPAKRQEILMYYNAFLEGRYQKLGMGNKTIYNYATITTKMDISDGIVPHWFDVMSEDKFLIPVPLKYLQVFLQGNLFKQNRILNHTCYILKNDDQENDQHLFKRDSWYLVRGRIKEKAYGLIQRLHHAAIYNFWKAEGARAEFRSSQIKQHCWKNTHLCTDNTFFQPLKWNSRFKIVFFWHLSICAAACLAFFMEKLIISKQPKHKVVKTNDDYDIIVSKMGVINIATMSILGMKRKLKN